MPYANVRNRPLSAGQIDAVAGQFRWRWWSVCLPRLVNWVAVCRSVQRSILARLNQTPLRDAGVAFDADHDVVQQADVHQFQCGV